jgi:hypothetical protein
MVDFGSSNTGTAVVYDTASTSATTYLPPVLLKGSSTFSVSVLGGRVGVAANAGETATGTFRTSQGSGQAPYLYLGPGVTTTAITAAAGTVFSRSDNTTTSAILSGSATYEFQGTGAHTTLTVGEGSTCLHRGTGTITTLNVAGTFDRTQETRALTVTTTNLYSGAQLLLNNGVSASVTRTNKNLVKCSLQDVEITLPLEEVF